MINRADSVRTYLENMTWGTVTIGGGPPIHQLVCPLCMAIIPASFDNAHQLPSHMTPKRVHIDYHVNIATALENAQHS